MADNDLDLEVIEHLDFTPTIECRSKWKDGRGNVGKTCQSGMPVAWRLVSRCCTERPVVGLYCEPCYQGRKQIGKERCSKCLKVNLITDTWISAERI